MNRSRRFDLWICGTLAVVCLLFLNLLVWEVQNRPRRDVAVASRSRILPVPQPPSASSPKHHAAHPIEAVGRSNPETKRGAQPQARVGQQSSASRQAEHISSQPSSGSQKFPTTPPPPKITTLEPLGYVEKADGSVDAIVSVREHAEVVHEGEILEDNFKVAKITSSAVELVENSAQGKATEVLAENVQGGVPTSPPKSPQKPSLPAPEVASSIEARRQSAASSVAIGSQPPVRQALGYVEKANGRVEAIFAEGNQVQLEKADKSFAMNFHAPEATPTNVEVARALPSANKLPESLAPESEAPQPETLTQEADRAPEVAWGAGSSTVIDPQGIPAGNGSSEFDPQDIAQSEPLADYSGNRFEPWGLPPNSKAEPTSPGVKAGDLPAATGEKGANQPGIMTLGYVEKKGGEREAIVEVFDQVYLVHEGELFAEKYRALRVTASSIEIVVEPKARSGVPPPVERNSEETQPPVSRWRGPPLPESVVGLDPPAKVSKTEKLPTNNPGISFSRPPPEHSVGSSAPPKKLKTVQANYREVRPANRSAQTVTLFPLDTTFTLGSVGIGSGEEKVNIANEGRVSLLSVERASIDSCQLCDFPSQRDLSYGRVLNSPFARGSP